MLPFLPSFVWTLACTLRQVLGRKIVSILLSVYWQESNNYKHCKAVWTNLSSFPFDFSWFRNRISALVYIKLFGEGFVLEVWILIKILQKKKHLCHICTNIRDDIYNVYVQSEPDDSQNLFYIQTWYPRTRWPPPLTSNEVLPRPPPPEELKLQHTLHPWIRPIFLVCLWATVISKVGSWG